MKEEKIQTLHPDAAKSGKNISLAKYEMIKKAMLSLLAKKTPTHLEMMEALYEKLKDKFEGNVHWYSETVKLDLEARKLITRTADKPQRYKLSKR